MSETYSCTLPDCHKVFKRASELKKHIKAHEDPDSVFHCSHCDFITLTKKNLEIHTAIHTGQKNRVCPHMSGQIQCDYRTNDPAALSKHRKKVHQYIPPPNRSRRKAAPASPCQPHQTKQKKVTRRRKPIQRIAASPRRRASRLPRLAKKPNAVSRDRFGFVISIPLIRLEDKDGNKMDIDPGEDFGYKPSSVTVMGTDDEVGLDTLFDSSLRPDWMAKYEQGYTTFDMAAMGRQLGALSENSPFDPAVLDARTGREGCLCPEWMVETRTEGWDKSVLEAHKDYYAIHA